MARRSSNGDAKNASKALAHSRHNDENDSVLVLRKVAPRIEWMIRDALVDARSFATKSIQEVFTVQAAADFLSVSKSTIERGIRRNEIPSFKFGRSRRIYRRDLLDFASNSQANQL